MKKFYLLLLSIAAFAAFDANAFNVTFRFDASTLAVSPKGIHVAGAFQNWNPGDAASMLTDPDCDFIYEVTLSMDAGTYEFKFVNSNNWNDSADEQQIPAACSANGAMGGNRTITVTGDQVFGPVCFNSCEPCVSIMPTSVPVTLRVDMSNETVGADGVHVAGDFQAAAGLGNNWTPAGATMTDSDGDDVYEISFNIAPGCYSYKFVNGLGNWESDPPAACNVGNNRRFSANNLGYDQTAICFNSCEACPSVVNYYDLTLQVDMSLVSSLADLAALAGISGFSLDDTISVAGSFQTAAGQANWTPGATRLTDPDGDKIYTLTVNIPQGIYQYKFINGTSWGVAESVPGACSAGGNRQVDLTANTILPVVCFGYCEAQCPPALPPVDITFRVDMSETVPSANGLFVAGSFQRPSQWDKASMQMTDTDEDGIYEYTYTVFPGIYQYKYFNGPNGDPDGETYNFEADGCGVPSGVGGFNRLFDGGGLTDNYKLPAFKFNTCIESLPGSVGIADNIVRLAFTASPNPFSGTTLIEFPNPNNNTYTLTISDITGKIVQQINQIQGNSITVERNNLPKGLYYATLRNEKGENGTQKLLVD